MTTWRTEKKNQIRKKEPGSEHNIKARLVICLFRDLWFSQRTECYRFHQTVPWNSNSTKGVLHVYLLHNTVWCKRYPQLHTQQILPQALWLQIRGVGESKEQAFPPQCPGSVGRASGWPREALVSRWHGVDAERDSVTGQVAHDELVQPVLHLGHRPQLAGTQGEREREKERDVGTQVRQMFIILAALCLAAFGKLRMINCAGLS